MKRIKSILITVIIAICSICAACGNEPTERLDAPDNMRIQGGKLVWDAVENAAGYSVYAENKEYEITECEFDISVYTAPKTYKIEVMAIGDGSRYADSVWASIEFVVKPEEPIIPTENLQYTLLTDGSGYEVSRGKADLNGRIVIPDEYNGLPVKKIAEKAFCIGALNADPYTGKGCNTKTTGFRLPRGLKEIGDYAFMDCTALTEITIPESVNSIGCAVFQNDIKLRQVKLPSTLTYIPAGLFDRCEMLASIEIPQTVSEIDIAAFWGCKSLKEIQLPENLQRLEQSAFMGCSSLIKMIIPKSITRLETALFEGCAALADIEFHSGIEFIGKGIITGTAWLSNQSDGFVTVNDWIVAYKGEIPDGGVIDALPSGIKHIAGEVFSKSDVVSLSLPDGVDIGASLCYQCEYLTDVKLPNDLKTIPVAAFGGCKSLKCITFPQDVEIISTRAFEKCISLNNITIPSKVTKIGDYAFSRCTSLNNIIIPSSVTEISVSAFYLCDGLTHVYYEGSEQQWNDKGLKISGRFDVYYYAETINDVPAGGGNYWHYDTDGKTPVVWANE